MSLTREQARQAGQIEAAITMADEALAAVQARIDDNSQIMIMSATLATGANVRAECPMTVEESAAVLEAILGVVQGKKTALESALAAVG